MVAAKELDFETEFLTHTTKASGSFLKDWKEGGSIDLFMHPLANPWSLWNHNWWRIAEEEDEEIETDDGEPGVIEVVRGMRANCLEEEELLKRQTWHDKKTGARQAPPLVCPLCKMVEWVRQSIVDKRIELAQPVFKFEAKGTDTPIDGSDTVVLYAGGLTKWFHKKNLTRHELDQAKRTGIKMEEMFKQNVLARQQYVLIVMSQRDIEAGWVIATEGPTLGKKMQKAIVDEIKRCKSNSYEGHSKWNPYPFRWEYDANQEFSEKYNVLAMTNEKLFSQAQVNKLMPIMQRGNWEELADAVFKMHEAGVIDADERILEKLYREPKPDTDTVVAPPNLRVLKQSMEAAALVDMPIDEFFERAVAEFGMPEPEDDEANEADEAGGTYEVQGEASSGSQTEEAEAAQPEGETIPCDHCQAVMGVDELVCTACGAEYGVSDDGISYFVKRPCGNCKAIVEVDEAGNGTCRACGAVHDEKWNFKLPKAQQQKQQGGMRRRGAAQAADLKPPRESKRAAARRAAK